MTVTTHNLGYPRIGAKRELKFALEDYWKGNSSLDALEGRAPHYASATGKTRAGWTWRQWATFPSTIRCWI